MNDTYQELSKEELTTMSLFKEFGTKAIVFDAEGNTIRQLEKPKIGANNKWLSYGDILTYPTKKEAELAANRQGFHKWKVKKVRGRLNFYMWVILYDARQNYYLACWDV